MINECSVVKDLIPLYSENLVSAETKEFIEEHCKSCEKCRELLAYADNRNNENEPSDSKKEKIWTEIANKERKKKKIKYILLSVGAVLTILTVIFIYSFLIKGNVMFATYEYNNSEQTENIDWLSEEDIKNASESVKQYFENNFGSCILLRLDYNEKLTADRDYHPEYERAIIFDSDYFMLFEPVAGDSRRMRTNWHWTVTCDSDGEWKVVNYGYG